jgi:hypothetical protein
MKIIMLKINAIIWYEIMFETKWNKFKYHGIDLVDITPWVLI